MKAFICIIVVALSFCCLTKVTEAEEAQHLAVADGAICTDVVDRVPVGSGVDFRVSVERLYCFTRIIGAKTPAEITHVWYFGDKERARVTLRVGSVDWRTKSSKKIQLQEIGSWRVDVVGPDGAILKTFQFAITP